MVFRNFFLGFAFGLAVVGVFALAYPMRWFAIAIFMVAGISAIVAFLARR